VFFVANKVDLGSFMVTFFEAREYCLANDMSFAEVSSLNGKGVQDLLNKLVESLI
jgi:hypothetical protein